MSRFLLRPSFLIPFALVTPYLFIGRVGITWLEGLLICVFLYGFLIQGEKTSPKPVLLVFMTLLLFGYSIALINGNLNFGVEIKYGDLKVFYWLLLAWIGFHFGYKNYQNNGQIASSKIFKSTLIILGCFAGSYPFLDDEIRELVMRNYYHPDIDSQFLGRIYSARFPGLGVNANTFAFMTLMLYYIALKAAIEKETSWIYPLSALIIITMLASKTVFALAIILGANLLLFSSVSRVIKLKFFTVFFIILSACMMFLFLTETGDRFQEDIEIIDRFIRLTETGSNTQSPQEDRLKLWAMGMERVQLSPFAGIAMSPISDEISPVNFCCPHNEFIAYWTFAGFLGLLAYVILIVWLIIKNLRSSQAYFWIGLYLALCIQMFLDAAFQAPRFIPLMFLIIGVNLRELDIYRMQRKRLSATTRLASSA